MIIATAWQRIPRLPQLGLLTLLGVAMLHLGSLKRLARA